MNYRNVQLKSIASAFIATLILFSGSSFAQANASDATVTSSSQEAPSTEPMKTIVGPTATSSTPSAQDQIQGNFFQRLGGFYLRDWKGTLPSAPTPARRALDAPLDSSPFPSADRSHQDRRAHV